MRSCPPPRPGQSANAGDDPFAAYLFPPERVMSHGLEIGLDDAQKTAIRNEVQKVQRRFLDVQFELQGESEKMVKLLQEKPVDETRVLAQVDRDPGAREGHQEDAGRAARENQKPADAGAAGEAHGDPEGGGK